MAASSLSRIERGEVPYAQDMLEALAETYRCTPADLLSVDPSDARESALLAAWRAAPPAIRRTVEIVLVENVGAALAESVGHARPRPAPPASRQPEPPARPAPGDLAARTAPPLTPAEAEKAMWAAAARARESGPPPLDERRLERSLQSFLAVYGDLPDDEAMALARAAIHSARSLPAPEESGPDEAPPPDTLAAPARPRA